jgi:hypothetical protein
MGTKKDFPRTRPVYSWAVGYPEFGAHSQIAVTFSGDRRTATNRPKAASVLRSEAGRTMRPNDRIFAVSLALKKFLQKQPKNRMSSPETT